ncbi:MAG TPA: hypothetical protein DDW65_04865, partial [Firmicutes bacterium]|nr:hypothetical protein [Bacillota bacterium]
MENPIKPHLSSVRILQYILPFSPYIIIFFSAMALMIIELVAGRLVGSHLGNSFYSWAAIIGVILMGNSIGNLLGGKIAKQKASFRLLAIIMAVSAVSCGLTLILNHLFINFSPFLHFNWPGRILGTILIIFTLPAVCLGAITPVISKLALDYADRPGATIGHINTWGSIGSISGTLLTGFILTALIGAVQIVLLAASILIILALSARFIGQSTPPDSIESAAGLGPRSDSAALSPALGNRPGKHFSWRYTPHLIVFISSGSLMMIELLGGRLISRYFGNSLYCWTSNIGTILLGMALGNFIGGKISEQPRPQKYLSPLFGVASIFTLSVLINMKCLWVSTLLNKLALPWQVLLTAMSTMLLPAIALSAITPLIFQLVLRASPNPNAYTIGSLNAWAIVGSIGGTLSAGFWLISVLGVIKALLLTAFIMATVSWWLNPKRLINGIGLLLIAIALWTAVAGPRSLSGKVLNYSEMLGIRPETEGLLFAADSQYQYVKVYQQARDSRHDLRVLALDSLIHGYIDIKNPANLQYEYEHIYQLLTLRYAKGKDQPRAFFIGAGSYTFPRWMLFQWPKAQIDVAEIDPAVVKANHLALGLSNNTPVHTFIGDARNVISDLPANTKYDLIYGDAFNDLSVPWHLTTLEFTRIIKSHLAPGGAYLLNIIDNYDNGLLLGAAYLTLKKTFQNVDIFCTNPLQIQNLRDTFVLIASDVPPDTGIWKGD